MKLIFSIMGLAGFTMCVIGRPQVLTSSSSDECDALNCPDNEDLHPRNLVCAVSDHGSVASFRSECGVKLLNCYQRLYNGPTYHVVARKVCAHRDILFLRGRCDQLVCDLDKKQPEKPACATNGDGVSLFKSACHIEILNCYQRMYGKPNYRQIASKNCGKMTRVHEGHPTDEPPAATAAFK